MKMPKPRIVELSTDKLEEILERAEAKQFNEEDYETIKAVFESYAYISELVEDKSTTIKRLRQLLFGARTEKTRDVIPGEGETDTPAAAEDNVDSTEQADGEQEEATPPKGHGRNGADDYPGAEKIPVPHASLESGDPCPDCKKGKVYEVAQPGVLIRITGQAPVQARIYKLQKLRCNLCGKVFTASPPEGVGSEKYDATTASMIALLKYGSGLPFNRLQGLQGNLGIPLPASTQWDIVKRTARLIDPVHDELIRQAAQGDPDARRDTTTTRRSRSWN